MSVNLTVFLLGLAISLVAGSGILIFYSAAYAEQAAREGIDLPPLLKRTAELFGVQYAKQDSMSPAREATSSASSPATSKSD